MSTAAASMAVSRTKTRRGRRDVLLIRSACLVAARTGAQWGVDDPTLMVSAAAAVTTHLAFGITHSVTYGTMPAFLILWFARILTDTM